MVERSSKRQRELLEFVDEFIKSNGYGPSYREIMRALGYKSVSTVAVHIDNLISKGYLIKRTHSARSLEVVSIDVTADEPAVSASDAAHRQWLVDVILTRLDQSRELTSDTIDNYKKLVESLRILGFVAEHKKAESKLARRIAADDK